MTDGTPKLSFTSCQFTSTNVYTASQDDAGANDCTVFPVDQSNAEAIMTTAAAAGMSTNTFSSWTWSGVNGKL